MANEEPVYAEIIETNFKSTNKKLVFRINKYKNNKTLNTAMKKMRNNGWFVVPRDEEDLIKSIKRWYIGRLT